MSSLRDIRRQLRSIENIKKITDSMERVAAVHLKRAQAKAEQSLPYISKMKEVVENLSLTEFTHPLFEQRPVKKTGLIVISADKGLSGTYNTNILSKTDDFLKKYSPDNIELFVIGRKALDYYRRRKWNIRYQRTEWGGKISFHDIKMLSNQIVNWFLSGEFDEIWLIYTHYINVMKRKVVVEKFLNIGKPQTEKKKVYLNYLLEPNPAEIFAEILPRYCVTRIQTALNEAYASELAARIVAMQTASRNAADMIERLTLVKNKMRQGDITREMIEISSGSENLK